MRNPVRDIDISNDRIGFIASLPPSSQSEGAHLRDILSAMFGAFLQKEFAWKFVPLHLHRSCSHR